VSAVRQPAAGAGRGPLRERLDVYRTLCRRVGGVPALASLVDLLEAELERERDDGPLAHPGAAR
jgi:hypothetical protein